MSNIQQIQPEKKLQVNFIPGNDYEFDKAMSSLDDMYSDMFDTSDSKRVPQSAVSGIDDMYSEMMGTKSKTELREEKITQEQIRVDLWNQSEPVQGFPVYIQQNNPYPAAPQYINVPQNQYMGQPMYPPYQQQQMNPYQQQQMNPYQQQQMNPQPQQPWYPPYQQQQMNPQTQNSNISAQYYYPQAPGNQYYPNPQYPDQPKQF